MNKKVKRIVAFIIVLVFVLAMILTPILSYAKGINDFDAEYYAIKYPDVVDTLGTDAEVLENHYNVYGKDEGRYKNEYEDPTMRYNLPYKTYVDVSIDEQMVRYYNQGIMVMQSICVTGDVATGKDTPRGTWKVMNHINGKWLNGPTWHNWVDFWMQFTPDACGFHDSTWRDDSEFNVEEYKTNGSHGCVNLPYGFAERLFNTIDVGTIVYVH